jgi:hypothetical protein
MDSCSAKDVGADSAKGRELEGDVTMLGFKLVLTILQATVTI